MTEGTRTAVVQCGWAVGAVAAVGVLSLTPWPWPLLAVPLLLAALVGRELT